MSTPKFEVAQIGKFGASGTGKRQTEADRHAITKTLLAVSPITVIGQLGDVYAMRLANGEEFDNGSGGVFTIKAPASETTPHSLACRICGKIHGKPTVEMVRNNEGWKANRLALLYLVSQNGKTFIVSESCMPKYVLPVANAKNVTNFADVLRIFGKK